MPHAVVGDEQPERGAVGHPDVDGTPTALPAHRKATLKGLGAIAFGKLKLKPPPLPTEHASTVPAPRGDAATLRVRTPVSPVAVTPQVVEPADASQGPSSAAEGQASALISERERLKARVAELERDARASAEAKTAAFPPAVSEAPPAEPLPAPAKAPATDPPPTWSAWAKLVFKLMGALAALATALAGYLALRTSSLEPKVAKLEDAKTDTELSRYYREQQEHEYRLKQRVVDECRWRLFVKVAEMQLPAPDRMGAVRKPEPFIDVCPEAPMPPPAPPAPALPPKRAP